MDLRGRLRRLKGLQKAPKSGLERVISVRQSVTSRFLSSGMAGVEVGAGSRPFPVPQNVTVSYGDIRDSERLATYFSGLDTIGGHATYDAQTMAGFADCSLDFVLSGHVIEHLENPIGAIRNTINVLKPGGFFILAVPDMRLTFDRDRPETSVDHVLRDFQDDGVGTRRQAYFEHLKFVHPIMTGAHLPAEEIEHQATASVLRYKELDVHFHAWTMDGFARMLTAARQFVPFDVVTAIRVENENIFVMRRNPSISGQWAPD